MTSKKILSCAGLLTMAGALCVLSPAPSRAADLTAPSYGQWGFDLSGRDTAVRPGDDFFGYANGTYLQRAWRDAHAGRVHAANDPERALQMFGAHEFGHKVDPGMY